MEDVRTTTAWVAAHSSHVTVDSAGTFTFPLFFSDFFLYQYVRANEHYGLCWLSCFAEELISSFSCNGYVQALRKSRRRWRMRYRKSSGILKAFTISTTGRLRSNIFSFWMHWISVSGQVWISYRSNEMGSCLNFWYIFGLIFSCLMVLFTFPLVLADGCHSILKSCYSCTF